MGGSQRKNLKGTDCKTDCLKSSAIQHLGKKKALKAPCDTSQDKSVRITKKDVLFFVTGLLVRKLI